jgi:methionyl-tRNA synthetase
MDEENLENQEEEEEQTVKFDDWQKLDIRVGKILEVEEHPNADKLYVLTVDFGDEIGKRTIVAGLKEYCDKTHLQGKTAIFVVNLEPVILRGVKSEGMILAASTHDKSQVCILRPDESDIEQGAKVS